MWVLFTPQMNSTLTVVKIGVKITGSLRLERPLRSSRPTINSTVLALGIHKFSPDLQ